MEACPPFSDLAQGLRGPASEFEALETLVHLSGAQLLCRAAESEARCGRVALGTGCSGRIPRHPLLPSHTCQGGCPQWSWGSDPRVGLHGFASSACLLTSTSQRGRRRAQLARGPFVSTVHFLSRLWETMHVSTKLPTRERRPRITPVRASSVCDFNTKTNHTPGTYLPTLLTFLLLEHSFITIFNLSGGFLFSTLVLDIMK